MQEMREIQGELVVCTECGRAFEFHEGGETMLPCGHPSVHYPPDIWLNVVALADELGKASEHCAGQEDYGCRRIGRMTGKRLRHMPVTDA